MVEDVSGIGGMNMITLQIKTAILRLFDAGADPATDPIRGVVFLTQAEPGVAYLNGAMGAVTREDWRQIEALLREQGFKECRWQSVTGGEIKEHQWGESE